MSYDADLFLYAFSTKFSTMYAFDARVHSRTRVQRVHTQLIMSACTGILKAGSTAVPDCDQEHRGARREAHGRSLGKTGSQGAPVLR